MEAFIVLVVVALAVLVVTGPLRHARAGRRAVGGGADLADLAAARDAKYREIREAELDYRTGKLSEDDWRAIDRALRAEAIGILRRLDRAREREPARDGGTD